LLVCGRDEEQAYSWMSWMISTGRHSSDLRFIDVLDKVPCVHVVTRLQLVLASFRLHWHGFERDEAKPVVFLQLSMLRHDLNRREDI